MVLAQEACKAGRVARHVRRLAPDPAAPSTRVLLLPAPTALLHPPTQHCSCRPRARTAFPACKPWVIGGPLCCVPQVTATALSPHTRTTCSHPRPALHPAQPSSPPRRRENTASTFGARVTTRTRPADMRIGPFTWCSNHVAPSPAAPEQPNRNRAVGCALLGRCPSQLYSGADIMATGTDFGEPEITITRRGDFRGDFGRPKTWRNRPLRNRSDIMLADRACGSCAALTQ